MDVSVVEQVKGALAERDQGINEKLMELGMRVLSMEQKQCESPRGQSFGQKSTLAACLRKDQAFEGFLEKTVERCRIPVPSNVLLKSVQTSFDSNGGAVAGVQRIDAVSAGPARQLRLQEIIPVIPFSVNSIDLLQELGFTNNAAGQATEGAIKAESDISYGPLRVDAVTIAHWTRASRQVLADSPAMLEQMSNRLVYGVNVRIEEQLISGTGEEGNLEGMLETATDYVGGHVGDNMIDTVRKALAQVQASDYMADAIVLNSEDWAAIELTKDSEGRYLFGDPNSGTPPAMWGTQVVATNSMPKGQFLAGAFAASCILLDREQAMIALSEHDGDNFTKNLVTARAEARVGFALHLPAGVVKGSFPA